MLPEIIIFSPKLISGGFYRWSRAYRLRFPAQSDDAVLFWGYSNFVITYTSRHQQACATSAATFFIVVLNYSF